MIARRNNKLRNIAEPIYFYSLNELAVENDNKKSYGIRNLSRFTPNGLLIIQPQLLEVALKLGFDVSGRCYFSKSIYFMGKEETKNSHGTFRERSRIKDSFYNTPCVEGGNLKMNRNTYYDDLYSILRRGGIRGLKDKVVDSGIKYAISKTKEHFGVEFNIFPECRSSFIDWLSQNDPEFKNHIVNPYILENPLNKAEPILADSFIFKIDKATFIKVTCGDEDAKYKTVKVYIFGKKTYKVYKHIKSMLSSSSDQNVLYSITARNDKDWICVGSSLVPRPMDTLFFDQDIKEKIVNHIQTWVSGREIYTSRGLIYKTGILLYGKAGTGKSSLATAIATYLNCPLISIDTTTFDKLNIPEVVDAINADETMYVVLIDEIDTIFKSREDQDMTEVQKANTAKLLSFLDSQQSPTNVIFVATTNYYDRLDKALTRKGRFDLVVKLADLHKDAAIEMCRSFDLTESQINNVLKDAMSEDTVNPATLQSRILEELKQ